MRNADGKAYRLAGSQRDVTDRKRAEEQLIHAALHDALTGLPNRTLFVDRLDVALKRRGRSQQAEFAVIFLDLDRFKNVNDSLGHSRGDELLRRIARRVDRYSGLFAEDTSRRRVTRIRPARPVSAGEPGAGAPAEGVHSATVFGPDAVITDALSTSVFVLGVDDGLKLIGTLPDYESIVIDAAGQVFYSDGLTQPGEALSE